MVPQYGKKHRIERLTRVQTPEKDGTGDNQHIPHDVEPGDRDLAELIPIDPLIQEKSRIHQDRLNKENRKGTQLK